MNLLEQLNLFFEEDRKYFFEYFPNLIFVILGVELSHTIKSNELNIPGKKLKLNFYPENLVDAYEITFFSNFSQRKKIYRTDYFATREALLFASLEELKKGSNELPTKPTRESIERLIQSKVAEEDGLEISATELSEVVYNELLLPSHKWNDYLIHDNKNNLNIEASLFTKIDNQSQRLGSIAFTAEFVKMELEISIHYSTYLLQNYKISSSFLLSEISQEEIISELQKEYETVKALES